MGPTSHITAWQSLSLKLMITVPPTDDLFAYIEQCTKVS